MLLFDLPFSLPWEFVGYYIAIPIRRPGLLNFLGFSDARDMAFSSSSAVKGVSWVICLERESSGMWMPLSCWASFMVGSAGAEGTAVGWSERDAIHEEEIVS